MRPTIVFLTTPDTARELRERLRRAGTYTPEPHFDRLTAGECEFGVDASGDVVSEYEDDELEELRRRLGEFEAICVEYRGVSCIRALVQAVLPGLDGVLDTNFGEFVDFPGVLARFRQDPEWDWRTSQS
ncbi:hypothetical protein [Saccharothrix variisporea]|uniref:Uncharacterized protein n=1 Tax=Saccharothrix variisporea TaxID=543527 RepID=A0A495WYQ2_9PSEU|nr:hypothetical protein [Saccharothrix variisporea]RKT66961.1 hypothetical protein DFJ66_0127 [Saccharothrix variisporea]